MCSSDLELLALNTYLHPCNQQNKHIFYVLYSIFKYNICCMKNEKKTPSVLYESVVPRLRPIPIIEAAQIHFATCRDGFRSNQTHGVVQSAQLARPARLGMYSFQYPTIYCFPFNILLFIVLDKIRIELIKF